MARFDRSCERKTVHFESYIVHVDHIGHRFADLMCANSEGVRVRVIYDWFGARDVSSWRFWRRMRQAGVEVRCFNPPRLDSPLGWLSRDHRKTIPVDGRIGFVSGLCVGQNWVGNPERGIEPWRDTGVVIEGPAIFDCIVVGDSVWDLLAARRAQALGVGLASGGYGQDELEKAGAYRTFGDPLDLLNHLDEVGVRIRSVE